MANTFFGLTIGSSGLFASNAAINTTAHNISNINTKGYTKQVSNQQAAESIRVYQSYGTVGITQRLLKIILMNLISMDLQKNTRIFFRQSMTSRETLQVR